MSKVHHFSEIQPTDQDAEDAAQKLLVKMTEGGGPKLQDDKKSEKDAKKMAKDRTDQDKGMHIGTILNGDELWSKDFEKKPELQKQLMAALIKCFDIVDRDCKFIVCANDCSEDGLAEKVHCCSVHWPAPRAGHLLHWQFWLHAKQSEQHRVFIQERPSFRCA